MPSSGTFIAKTLEAVAREQAEVEQRYHLEIADKLIFFLSNDSIEGSEKIQNAVKDAGKQYTADDYNWLLSSILTYWHGRKVEARSTERDIVNYSDLLIRFQTLAKVFLNPKGGWESTSYNSLLLVHFMRAIDSVSDDCNDVKYYKIIEKIRDVFKLKLQNSLHDYLFSQLQAAAEAQQLKAISEKAKVQAVNAVKLFDNSKEAAIYAEEHHEEVIFCLSKMDEAWSLYWFNLYGEETELEVSDELKALLSQTDGDESELKLECLKLRDLLIEERKVLINPPAVLLNGLKLTFVLKGNCQDYSLDWYDANGLYRVINLSKYSQLSLFLKEQVDFNAIDMKQIERHLRHVNVKEKEGILNTIEALDHFFGRKGSKDIKTSPAFRLLVNPANSELTGMESTFVLYKNQEGSRLEWYGTYGIQGPDLELDSYPKLARWIDAQKTTIQADNQELKKLLAEVDTSKKVDRSAIKEALNRIHSGKIKAMEEKTNPESSCDKTTPGKLNLSQFSKVATLFGQRTSIDSEDALNPSESVRPH